MPLKGKEKTSCRHYSARSRRHASAVSTSAPSRSQSSSSSMRTRSPRTSRGKSPNKNGNSPYPISWTTSVGRIVKTWRKRWLLSKSKSSKRWRIRLSCWSLRLMRGIKRGCRRCSKNAAKGLLTGKRQALYRRFSPRWSKRKGTFLMHFTRTTSYSIIMKKQEMQLMSVRKGLSLIT